jgi:hypothetical protein
MRFTYKGLPDACVLLKSKKLLFRSLKDNIEPPQTKESSNDSDKQITELDSPFLQFTDLEKYDYRNITLYDEKGMDVMCDMALEHFKHFTDKVALKFSVKCIKDELVKIFIICFNYISNYLVLCISNENDLSGEKVMKALDQLLILNQFLLFTLNEKKNPIILGQYDIAITRIAKEAIDQVHKQLTTPDKCKDKVFIATFLCYQLQILAMMVALNEGRNFMKTAATESIKTSFETFGFSVKSSISNPLIKEIYRTHLGDNETWVTLDQEHIKAAIGSDRIKFYIIQLSSQIKSPRFSLRHMTLFYLLKFLQLFSLEENVTIKEHIFELIASVLKDNLEFVEEKALKKDLTLEDMISIEIAFSESLVCLSMLKRTAPKTSDHSALLDKLGFMHFLKPVIECYLKLALKFHLIVTFSKDTGYNEESKWKSVSYRTTHDYVSGIFNFLHKVKNAKDQVGLTRISRSGSSAATILTLVEEILGTLIKSIDFIEGTDNELLMLKVYLAEYLFDNRLTMSRQTAEHVIKLITSKRFHYTSPHPLLDSESQQELPLEEITNKRIITLLQHIIEYDKTWAEIILQHLVKLIPELLRDEECLFGLCKLIYCGVTGEFRDNSSFYKKIFKESSEPLTFQSYNKIEPRGESKAIKGFIDIKGVSELTNTLLTKFYTNGTKLIESDRVIRMVESLFLEIIGLPLISHQVLSEIPLIISFMEYIKIGPDPNAVIVKFLEKLLAAIKYKSKIHEKVHELINEKSNYLPRHIITFIRTNIQSKNTRDVMLTIPFIELLVKFITQEPKAPSVKGHQTAIGNIVDLEMLLDEQKEHMNEPYIGQMLKVFLMFLGKLQENNKTEAIKLNNSSIIREKKFYKFFKELISKVELVCDV